MTKENNQLVIGLGVLGLAYFGVLKPITNALGLTKDVNEKKRAQLVEQVSAMSAWNPSFYNQYQAKAARGTVLALLTQASLTSFAQQIRNAWGIFNDDEDKIYAVFKALRNQLQLSQLCEKYSALYKEDLLQRLQNPWNKSNDGLLPEEFKKVADIVVSLPVNSIPIKR